MEPDRCNPPFAVIEKLTVPLPVPLAPDVMVKNASVLLAVQLHPAGALTVTLPVPPPAEKFWLAGLIAVTQLVPLRNAEIFGYVTLKRP